MSTLLDEYIALRTDRQPREPQTKLHRFNICANLMRNFFRERIAREFFVDFDVRRRRKIVSEQIPLP